MFLFLKSLKCIARSVRTLVFTWITLVSKYLLPGFLKSINSFIKVLLQNDVHDVVVAFLLS